MPTQRLKEKKMITYIQCYWGSKNTLETVDEFNTRKEATEMINEYRISDPSGTFYLSSRPCNNWR